MFRTKWYPSTDFVTEPALSVGGVKGFDGSGDRTLEVAFLFQPLLGIPWCSVSCYSFFSAADGDAKGAEVRLIVGEATAEGGIIPVLEFDTPPGEGGPIKAPAELIVKLVDGLPGMVPLGAVAVLVGQHPEFCCRGCEGKVVE